MVLPFVEVEKEIEWPSEEAMKKYAMSCVGFAGYLAKKELRSKLSMHPALRESVYSQANSRKQQVIVSSWVEGARFGAYGRALAKRPWIESNFTKQSNLLLEGKMTKKVRNMTQQRTVYNSDGSINKEASGTIVVRNFEKYKEQVGWRVNSKGKTVPKYKTKYRSLGVSDGVNDTGILRFKLKNGEWRSTYGFQIASRPESQHWDNWIINYWTDSVPGYMNIIDNYLNTKFNQIMEDIND